MIACHGAGAPRDQGGDDGLVVATNDRGPVRDSGSEGDSASESESDDSDSDSTHEECACPAPPDLSLLEMRIATLEQMVVALETTSSLHDTQLAETGAALTDVDDEIADLRANAAARDTALANINTRLTGVDRDVAALQTVAAALESELSDVNAVLARVDANAESAKRNASRAFDAFTVATDPIAIASWIHVGAVGVVNTIEVSVPEGEQPVRVAYQLNGGPAVVENVFAGSSLSIGNLAGAQLELVVSAFSSLEEEKILVLEAVHMGNGFVAGRVWLDE